MGMQERSEKNSAILVYHTLALHHSLRIVQDMEMRALLKFVQNAILYRNGDRAVFGSFLMKLKQESRFIRSRS